MYETKKCPYCSVNLQLNDKVCFSCKNKVGDVNEFGIAKKPIAWFDNIVAIIAGSGFIAFIVWLFFLRKGE